MPQLDQNLDNTNPAAGDAKGAQESSWSDLFKPGLRKGVLIGCMLFVFQQFSGINALIYFSSSVFRQVGRPRPECAAPTPAPQGRGGGPRFPWGIRRPLSSLARGARPLPRPPSPAHPYPQAGITSDALASAAVGATNVIGTLIATSLIERAGRKQLLMQSYFGMAAAMLIMAAGFVLPALAPFAGGEALCACALSDPSLWPFALRLRSARAPARPMPQQPRRWLPTSTPRPVCVSAAAPRPTPPSPAPPNWPVPRPRSHRSGRHALLHPLLCHRGRPRQRPHRAGAQRRARQGWVPSTAGQGMGSVGGAPTCAALPRPGRAPDWVHVRACPPGSRPHPGPWWLTDQPARPVCPRQTRSKT
jgi:hypothetical protein